MDTNLLLPPPSTRLTVLAHRTRGFCFCIVSPLTAGPMDTNLHTHGLHDAPGMQEQSVPVQYTGQDNIVSGQAGCAVSWQLRCRAGCTWPAAVRAVPSPGTLGPSAQLQLCLC